MSAHVEFDAYTDALRASLLLIIFLVILELYVWLCSWMRRFANSGLDLFGPNLSGCCYLSTAYQVLISHAI